MEQALFKRLEAFHRLSHDDRAALASLRRRTVEVPARRDLVREGEPAQYVNIILRGWACRYKMLSDGRRSLIGALLPGEFCDLKAHALSRMDHSIAAITNILVAQVAPEDLNPLIDERPRIRAAMLAHDAVTCAVQREWTHNLASRGAYERLAHLLVELFLRMRAGGLTKGNTCDFPLTQSDLAEATGLTPVHINRTLQALRAQQLITLQSRQLTILHLEKLAQAAMFNSHYLQSEPHALQLGRAQMAPARIPLADR